ncbi:hypothetical protein [Frankia sp. Cr2]|nr:hypothetical protein [Frankia sp. Cr2]
MSRPPRTLTTASHLAATLRDLGERRAAREWEAFVRRHRREP